MESDIILAVLNDIPCECFVLSIDYKFILGSKGV